MKKGTKVGRLTILGQGEPLFRNGRRIKTVDVVCDCGTNKTLIESTIKYKRPTKSCGCLLREVASKVNRKHGLSTSPLYRRWLGMMSRCHKKTNTKYKDYGGRGIKVCPSWHEFMNFYNDNKESFKPELELDRIDNNKGYSPENCRWATRAEQCLNKRTNRFLTYKGKKQTVSEWAKELPITDATLRGRLQTKTLKQIIGELNNK